MILLGDGRFLKWVRMRFASHLQLHFQELSKFTRQSCYDLLSFYNLGLLGYNMVKWVMII